MKACTQIVVELKNADPTALTACGSLQRSLGFGSRLAQVERRVLWELQGPVEADAIGLIDRMRRAGQLWNPNKERARVRGPQASFKELGLIGSGQDSWTVFLAWNPEIDFGGIVRRFVSGQKDDWHLARGILWSLRWSSGNATDWEKWGTEAAVCTAGDSGLLIHPHLEDFRVIEETVPPPWLPHRLGEGR